MFSIANLLAKETVCHYMCDHILWTASSQDGWLQVQARVCVCVCVYVLVIYIAK